MGRNQQAHKQTGALPSKASTMPALPSSDLHSSDNVGDTDEMEDSMERQTRRA